MFVILALETWGWLARTRLIGEFLAMERSRYIREKVMLER